MATLNVTVNNISNLLKAIEQQKITIEQATEAILNLEITDEVEERFENDVRTIDNKI